MKSTKIIILVIFFISFPLNNLFPCIMITAANDSLVIAGNNEDYSDPDTFLWFYNKSEFRKYSSIYFGYSDHHTQGGMNDAGLCFDAFATVPNPVVVLPIDELPWIPRPAFDFIMKNCGTVTEVLSLMSQYDLSFMKNFQMMFADKYGGSVIIEGKDVIWKNDYFQVCTNFYHSNPELGGYPCWRYDKAVEIFNEYPDSISAPLFRDILDATHQEGQFPTLYTNIYDLKNGMVHLYFNHHYDEVVHIDLQKGLELGNRTYKISSLYSSLSIKSPITNSIVSPNNVNFVWEGIGNSYQLQYSTDPEFENYEVIEIRTSDFLEKANIPYIFAIIIPFFLIRRKIKIRRFVQIILITTISLIFISCSANSITSPNNDYDVNISDNLITVTIHNLHPDATYYWQVKAERNGPFMSESPIYSFITSE